MKHCNSYVFEVLVALEQFEFALLVAVKIFFQFYSNFCSAAPTIPKIFKFPNKTYSFRTVREI